MATTPLWAVSRLPKAELDHLRPLAADWQPQFWPFADLAASWHRPEVGALVASPLASGPPFATLIYAADSRLGFGELLFLFVSCGQRRVGAGRALLTAYHEELGALGCAESFLEVRLSNEAAIVLYERAGYTRTRQRRDYYGPGEDGIDMVRKIS